VAFISSKGILVMVSQYYAKNHGFNFGNGAWLFLSLVIEWTMP